LALTHALNDLVNTRELPSACLFLLVLRGIVFNLNYLNYNYLHRMKKNTAKNSSSSSRDDNKANANAKTQRQRRKHEKTSRRLRSEKRERENTREREHVPENSVTTFGLQTNKYNRAVKVYIVLLSHNSKPDCAITRVGIECFYYFHLSKLS